jgi:hypothetical protein
MIRQWGVSRDAEYDIRGDGGSANREPQMLAFHGWQNSRNVTFSNSRVSNGLLRPINK